MNTPAGQSPLSPIPITSRPVRARLDQVKADLSEQLQRRLGRDATWNEVAELLLDEHDAMRMAIQARRGNDHDNG